MYLNTKPPRSKHKTNNKEEKSHSTNHQGSPSIISLTHRFRTDHMNIVWAKIHRGKLLEKKRQGKGHVVVGKVRIKRKCNVNV